MTDYLWLLARLYVTARLGYIAAPMWPLLEEIERALDGSAKAPRAVSNCTDSEIQAAFSPTAEVVEPAKPIAKRPRRTA